MIVLVLLFLIFVQFWELLLNFEVDVFLYKVGCISISLVDIGVILVFTQSS